MHKDITKRSFAGYVFSLCFNIIFFCWLCYLCVYLQHPENTHRHLKPSDLECMHIRHRLTCKLCEMNEALTWVKISIRLPNWTSDELCALHFLHLPPYLFFFLSFFRDTSFVIRNRATSCYRLLLCVSHTWIVRQMGGFFLPDFVFCLFSCVFLTLLKFGLLSVALWKSYKQMGNTTV